MSTTSKQRILVVDDDVGQRSLLTSFLGSQGYDVTAVESGTGALTHIRESRVDMVISDVRMPL